VNLQAQQTRRGQRRPKGAGPHTRLPALRISWSWGSFYSRSTKMMDKTARHITVATRETFVRMKALHTSILEANREGGKDDSIRENGQDAAIVCSKCSRSLQSADKEQHTTPVWRKDAAAQLAPPSTRPMQHKSAKAPRSTRMNLPKGPQESEATHAGASKIVSPANRCRCPGKREFIQRGVSHGDSKGG